MAALPAWSHADMALTAQDGALYRRGEGFEALSLPWAADPRDSLEDWTKALVWWCLRGRGWREVSAEGLDATRRRMLTQALEWARWHAEGLRGGRMVLGNPERGEVYGFFYPSLGLLAVRNPSLEPQRLHWDWRDERGEERASPFALRRRVILERLYPFPQVLALPAARPWEEILPPAGVAVFRRWEEGSTPPMLLGPRALWLRTSSKDTFFEVWGPAGEEVAWELLGLPEVQSVRASQGEIQWRREGSKVTGRLRFPGSPEPRASPRCHEEEPPPRPDEARAGLLLVEVPTLLERAEVGALWETKGEPRLRWEKEGEPWKPREVRGPGWILCRFSLPAGLHRLRWGWLREAAESPPGRPRVFLRGVRILQQVVVHVRHSAAYPGSPPPTLPFPPPEGEEFTAGAEAKTSASPLPGAAGAKPAGGTKRPAPDRPDTAPG